MEKKPGVYLYDWMFDLFKSDDDKRSTFDWVKTYIFAVVFSFWQDGKSKWYGQQKTLAERAHTSERAVCKKLKELVDEGWLVKETESHGMFKHNCYSISKEKLNAIDWEYIAAIDSESIAMYPESIAIDSESINNNIDNKIPYNNISTMEERDLNHGSYDTSYVLATSSPTYGVLVKNNIDMDKGARPPLDGFEIPTLEQVKRAAETNHYDAVDVEDFYNRYTAGGWKDKGGNIFDWRVKLYDWNRREKKREKEKDNKPKRGKELSVSKLKR